MKWSTFIDTIYTELKSGKAFDNFLQPIKNEQDLTEITALKIRNIFAQLYGLPDNSDIIFNHVQIKLSTLRRTS